MRMYRISILLFFILSVSTISQVSSLTKVEKKEISRYGIVTELPWNSKIESNCQPYINVTKNDNYVYEYLEKKELMQGEGIYELQLQLAYVFNYFNFYDVYLPNYIENKELRVALTSGIFNEETEMMVKKFQEIYMGDIFKGDEEKYYGFGVFDKATYERLDKLMLKVRVIYTEEKNEERARNARKIINGK